jgi:site-specific recombinase XerC
MILCLINPGAGFRMTTMTLRALSQRYFLELKATGKSERTLYTYQQDMKQILAFFGADKSPSVLTFPGIGKFLKSGELRMLPNGRARATPTVQKTIRVLRQFVVWLHRQGILETVPLPQSILLGRMKKEAGRP